MSSNFDNWNNPKFSVNNSNLKDISENIKFSTRNYDINPLIIKNYEYFFETLFQLIILPIGALTAIPYIDTNLTEVDYIKYLLFFALYIIFISVFSVIAGGNQEIKFTNIYQDKPLL